MTYPPGVADLCSDLVHRQCCARGLATRIKLEGTGPASIAPKETFDSGAASEVTFSPAVRIGPAGEAGTAQTKLTRPERLEPFPLTGEAQSYTTHFDVTGPTEAAVTFRIRGDDLPASTSFTGSLSDGTHCKACSVVWSQGVDWHLGIRFATPAPHPLSAPFPFLPSGHVSAATGSTKAAVTRAEVVFAGGTVTCARPEDAGSPLQAGESLVWSRAEDASIDVSAIVLRDGGLDVTVRGTVPPTRILPSVAPPIGSVPTLIHETELPWTGIGIAIAVFLIAAVFFVRWRYRKQTSHLVPPIRIPKGSASAPVDIFYSYSEVDATLVNQLRHCLSPLKKGGVTREHDGAESDTSRAETEIASRLDQAHIVLVLFSADYAANDRLWAQMESALERQKRGGVVLIPILLRSCDVEPTPLDGLVLLPRSGVPIANWPNPKDALFEVALEIHKHVEERIRRARP